jgi:hypothetical protein
MIVQHSSSKKSNNIVNYITTLYYTYYHCGEWPTGGRSLQLLKLFLAYTSTVCVITTLCRERPAGRVQPYHPTTYIICAYA